MNVELEKLEKRISELEAIVKKGSFNAFGRAYSTTGSSNSDFLIKTKGQVKIQWGSKFIDLIKDGKINVDAKFIYKQDSVGVKDGIYIIGEGDETQVILQVGGNQINLKGEVGTTYVSFQAQQKTTSDQKYTALTNIGFIYKNLEQVNQDGLNNGIIYVESDQKLYIVQEGALSEFVVNFPNPLTKQLIIQKSDESQGSLLIVGSGIQNSIAFDNFYIYSQPDGMFINSAGEIFFRISEQEKVKINNDAVIFSTSVVSSMFKSNNATEDIGFRLYFKNGQSTLEVDNLIVRNSSDDNTIPSMYPYTWYYRNNVIKDVDEAQNPDDPSQEGFAINLIYENEFEVGQTLYTYAPIQLEEGFYKYLLLPLKVEMLNTEGNANTVFVSIIEELIDQAELESFDSSKIFQQLQGQTIFLISIEGQPIVLLRKKDNNIDLVEVEQPDDATGIDKVILRIGDIEELKKNGRENKQEIPIKGSGLYSKNAAFLKAQYTSDYELPPNDNSTKFASTEWINKLLPPGSIIMFSGTANEIPENWNICNGTNGTPNLIGKFIKAAEASGETGGKEEIELTLDNLPKHTHTFVGGQMKTSTDGEHTHTYSSPVIGKSDNANDRDVAEKISTGTTSSSGAHFHTIDMSSAKLSEEGGGTPLKWEPLYYALIYIMKLR